MRRHFLKRRENVFRPAAVAGFFFVLMLAVLSFKNISAYAMLDEEEYTGPVPVCPKCHSNADVYVWEVYSDGSLYCVCYNDVHWEDPDIGYVYPFTYTPSSAPDTVYRTVTYVEYLSASNPAPTTSSLSVEDWGYHRINGKTVDEYTKDNVRYVFTGNWLVNGEVHPDNDRLQIKTDTTIEPIYESYHTIIYLNADQKTTYKTFEVKQGDTHKILTDYPEKKETDKYIYEFAGWTFSREVVSGWQVIDRNKYYYPSYNAVPKTSTVKYLDATGKVYKEETVNKGTSFKLPATGPEKASTSSMRYEFAGWAVNGVKVEGKSLSTYEDMTITPVYNEFKIETKVTVTPKPKVTDIPPTTAPEPDEDGQDENPDDIDGDNPDEPVVTEEPVVTDEPAVTDSPAVTEEPAITDGPDNSSNSGTEGDNSNQSGQNTDAAVTEGPKDNGDDLEEIDLDDDNKTPMGAIVAGSLGGIAVLAGIGVAIAKATGGAAAATAAGTATKAAAGTVKAAKAAKAAKNAAKVADAAAKTKAIRDIELEAKTILLAVSDSDLRNELTALFGKKKFMAVKTTKASDAAEITSTAAKIKAELVVIDTMKNETAQAFVERAKAICPKGSEFRLVAVSNDSYTSVSEDTFKALKAGGTLTDYTSAGVSGNQKLVKLILPVYKPELDVEHSAEFIGHVTDALGIPFVSNIIELFVNGKEIKEALEVKSVDASDVSTVVGNIAALFGLDAIEDVSKLINGIDTARDVARTEDVSEVDDTTKTE